MTLTEENNLTKEQLLEMLHEAWDKIEYLEDQVECQDVTDFLYDDNDLQEEYDKGHADGYDSGFQAGYDKCLEDS